MVNPVVLFKIEVQRISPRNRAYFPRGVLQVVELDVQLARFLHRDRVLGGESRFVAPEELHHLYRRASHRFNRLPFAVAMQCIRDAYGGSAVVERSHIASCARPDSATLGESFGVFVVPGRRRKHLQRNN